MNSDVVLFGSFYYVHDFWWSDSFHHSMYFCVLLCTFLFEKFFLPCLLSLMSSLSLYLYFSLSLLLSLSPLLSLSLFRWAGEYIVQLTWKEHVALFKSIHDRALFQKEAFYRSHFVMGRRVHCALSLSLSLSLSLCSLHARKTWHLCLKKIFFVLYVCCSVLQCIAVCCSTLCSLRGRKTWHLCLTKIPFARNVDNCTPWHFPLKVSRYTPETHQIPNSKFLCTNSNQTKISHMWRHIHTNTHIHAYTITRSPRKTDRKTDIHKHAYTYTLTHTHTSSPLFVWVRSWHVENETYKQNLKRDLLKRAYKRDLKKDLQKRPMKETLKEIYKRDLWKRP